jgi:hypothetical protein
MSRRVGGDAGVRGVAAPRSAAEGIRPRTPGEMVFGPAGPNQLVGSVKQDRAVPLRFCAGCRARRPKGELIRFARGPAGPALDASGRAGGRGAYTCRDPDCLDRALRRGSLARTLRVPVSAADAAALRVEAVEYLVGGHGETTRS